MGKSKIEKMPGFGGDGLLITLPYGKYEENIKFREKANKNRIMYRNTVLDYSKLYRG